MFLLARYLGGQGWSEAQIAAHLTANRGLYASQSGAPVRNQEIARAARFGAAWGANIGPMQTGHLDDTVNREWMMRNTGIPQAYRFSVLFSRVNPATGQREYNTVMVNSSTNLTMRQIRDLAITTYAELARNNPSFQRFAVNWRTSWLLTTAERRTGA